MRGLFYLLVWLISLAVTAAGPCPAGCVECSRLAATCTTTDFDPFPQSLDKNIHRININYQGHNSFELKASHLRRYTKLRSLTLSGNVDRIEDKTFEHHWHTLVELNIHHTTTQVLPLSMFGYGNIARLTSLRLDLNNFTKIPLLSDLGLDSLKTIDLSYNPLDLCNSSQNISSQFLHMKTLVDLNLAGIGNPDQCHNIDKHFFKPLRNIIKLNLSRTGFFHGSQDILYSLQNVEFLILDDISPFNECPAQAKYLFGNISASLKHLQARKWQDSKSVNSTCFMTDNTLEGLIRLPQLTHLDFGYGDQIFGHKITQTIFKDFKHLKSLNLAWCGITEIEEGALTGLQLESFVLDGNPLFSMDFWASGKFQDMPSLRNVSLSATSANAIKSYTPNLSFIPLSVSEISYLDVSANMFRQLPSFTLQGIPLPILQQQIRIRLSENLLSTLQKDKMVELCHAMPSIAEIDFSHNMIHKVEYLCLSLTSLNFENNQLGNKIYQKANLEAIQQVHRLMFLSLSGNSLDFLSASTFTHMIDLRELRISRNNLYYLDTYLFMSNEALLLLDLSSNLLRGSNISRSLISNRLTSLDLSNNYITKIDRKFIEYSRTASSLNAIYLANNSFDCSCGQLYVQEWVRNASNHQLMDGGQLQCATPISLRFEYVSDYKQPPFDCHIKWVLVALAYFICVIVLVSLCYRSRWYLIHLQLSVHSIYKGLKGIGHLDKYRYDAMIIFDEKSDVDVGVVKRLMIELEGGNYLQPINHVRHPDGRENRVYIRVRDALIGSIGFEQCCLAIEQSRKIILVLSNSFLQNSECVMESIHVGRKLFSTKRHSCTTMMSVILEDLDYDLIRETLR